MTLFALPVRALSQNIASRSHYLLARASLTTNPLLRVSQKQSTRQLSQDSRHDFVLDSALPQQSRNYATTAPAKPVGRPKAHTGRAPAKRAPRTKSATATKTTTAKKSTAAKKTGVRRTTKRKTVAKKATPRKKKPLSKTALKRQQTQASRELKEKALLDAPKRLPATAWALVFTESAVKGAPIDGTGARSAAQKYRNIDAAEHERLNHTANENRAKNVAAYKRWLSTYTPKQVKEANNARNQLRKEAKAAGKKTTYPHIKDDRLVKQPRNAYSYFLSARVASGDMKNMKITEIGGLVAREWKALNGPEKKTYDDMAAKDRNRYAEEAKSVYGQEVRPRK